MSETHAAAMSTTVPQSTPDRAPAQGHLYIRAAAGPAEVHFMFEQQEKRLGGAMGASVITHGAFLLLILLIIRLAPEAGTHAMLLERAPHEIIWLAEPGAGGGVYRPGNGVESPRLLRSVRPNYTAEAMRAKVQGVVRLEGVVLPDGSVGDVKVMRSLDPVFGLDQEAVKAAKQFRFVPGTRFGEPVAVLVSFEIEFTLRWRFATLLHMKTLALC